jgi:chromate transporter
MTKPLPAHQGRAAPRAYPASLRDLFVSFTWLALQGFGGVLAIMQRVLVEHKRWLTDEEFVEDWAVAQIMPGPNVVNLSLMVGGRFFGLPGALAALAGMLAAPLVLVLVLALLYAQWASLAGVAGALRGMGSVTAGLIGATGLRLISTVRTSVLGRVAFLGIAACAFVAVAVLRVPLGSVLCGLGALSCLLAYRRLPA